MSNIKYTVINSEYNEKTGISTVTIQTKEGIFIGTSKLHDEDSDIPSKYAGCRYAEIKAVIKALKHKAKIVKIKYQTVKEIYDNLFNEYIDNNLSRKYLSCDTIAALQKKYISCNKEFSLIVQQKQHLQKEYIDLCTKINDEENVLIITIKMRDSLLHNRIK